MLQSVSNSITIDVFDDELNFKIQYSDPDDINDTGGVISGTTIEFMAGIDFIPQDQKKMMDQLMIAFERLQLEEYEDETMRSLQALGDLISALVVDEESDGTPTT